METLLNLLRDRFTKATLTAFPNLELTADTPIDITQSTQSKFGDYQFNSAMKLSKVLKQNPRSIAEAILSNVLTDSLIKSVEIAGPGFINITLDPLYLSQRLNTSLPDPHLGVPLPQYPQKIVIDFSSPNTAKEMHVGHLRSTIIGDSLARLFEFLGHNVLRLNHIGDWGTAFGMLITYMREEVPQVIGNNVTAELADLVSWYKSSKKKFDEDPAFKKRSQQAVVALQSGEPNALLIWERICAISETSYKNIYDLLGVKLITRGESFYNPYLAPVIADLESKGLVQVSDGAKCLFLEGFINREGDPLPLMLQKSDGGYNYDTTDMAAIRHRIQEEKADRIIVVTDAGQSTHFQMIFKAAEEAGYLDPNKVRVDHVPFGLVLGLDGKKFKTRSGDTEPLIDLLYNAITKAEEILISRDPNMDDATRKKLAKALGIGAVKYADLSCNRISDYTFSYERMLKFEGNTAAFIMYSYVRIEGIKRKVQTDIKKMLEKGKISLDHPSEIALGLHLLQFGEILEKMGNDLMPHYLTDYLYGLAEKFNVFFRDCRVEGSEQQDSRLLLSEMAARTLKQGLNILGVETVDKM